MDVNTLPLELVGVAIFTQYGLLKIVYPTRVAKKTKGLSHSGYTVAPSLPFDPTTEPLCLYLLYRHSLSQFLIY